MKTEILKQENILGKSVTVYGTIENPLFLAKDVAEWIEHTDASKMVQTVDEDEKLTRTLFVSGQNREVLLLTENGLYEVLFQSRKPIAKAFKKEVKAILHSIRKHGGYLTPQKIEEVLSDPDTIIKLATDLKKEREARIAAEVAVQKKQAVIEHLEPKASMADQIINCGKTVDITTFAKLIGRQPNKFFDQLRQDGYLYYRDGFNLPKQQYANKYFVTKTIPSNRNGFYIQSRITGRGMDYLFKKYVDEPNRNTVGQQLMSFIQNENLPAIA